MDKRTWRLVQLPAGREALDCKWIFRKKLRTNRSLEKYKARLVAKGYDQVVGLDYNETFSPMIKMTTIKLLLASATILDCKIQQMDVNSTFLNGNLNEIIYMKQPKEFIHKVQKRLVCLLSNPFMD
jgi:hypothetical protein